MMFSESIMKIKYSETGKILISRGHKSKTFSFNPCCINKTSFQHFNKVPFKLRIKITLFSMNYVEYDLLVQLRRILWYSGQYYTLEIKIPLFYTLLFLLIIKVNT